MRNNKIIYQIMIDRFSGNITCPKSVNEFMGGDIKGIISHLDYIQKMGFNTILLTPFVQSSNYHGYHTEDFYKVDTHFGTTGDIVLLIEEAKKRGLKLMLDFVPNHCSNKHPFFVDALCNKKSIYRDWFYIYDDNSYKSFLNYDVLPKINLNNKDAAEYIINACIYWVDLGFDFVRIDHAVGPPKCFLRQLRDSVIIKYPDVLFFGEIWVEGVPLSLYNTFDNKMLQNRISEIEQEDLQLDYLDVLDGVLDFEFANIMIDHVSKNKRCVNNIELQRKVNRHFNNYPSDFELILFLDNHDMNRFLYYCDNDTERLLDAIQFMKQQNRSFSIYYGTEAAMHNSINIFNGGSYADLNVRDPFQKATEKLTDDIAKIITEN